MSDYGYKPSSNVSFIVKNNSRKNIRIFNYGIDPGQQRDLMKIPSISEEDIRVSLLKGRLQFLVSTGQISIVSSDIEIIQFNASQQSFLQNAGISNGFITWASQDSWTIDSVNGNDNNAGTAAAPLQTLTEWARRIGGKINIAMTVTINSDLLSTDQPRDRIQVNSSGSLTITGIPTIVYTATSGNVTITQRVDTVGSNAPAKVTDTGLADPSPYIADLAFSAYRYRTTTGSHPGAIFWPMKKPAASQANISAPMVPDSTLGPYGQTNVTIASGDVYVVEKLPTIAIYGLYFDVSPRSNNIQAVTIQNIACSDISGNILGGNDTGGATQICYYGCSFHAPTIDCGGFIDCRFSDGTYIRGSALIFGGLCAGIMGFLGFPQTSIVDFLFAIQGGQLGFYGPTCCLVAQLQSWDFISPGAMVAWQDGSGILEPIFGGAKLYAGNSSTSAGYFRTEGGGKFHYNVDTSGMVGQGTGGTTVAQIGVPAAGKTLVQLPFYDSTVSASGMIKL